MAAMAGMVFFIAGRIYEAWREGWEVDHHRISLSRLENQVMRSGILVNLSDNYMISLLAPLVEKGLLKKHVEALPFKVHEFTAVYRYEPTPAGIFLALCDE